MRYGPAQHRLTMHHTVPRPELPEAVRSIRSGQSLLFTGGRGFGKTVLLKQLERSYQQSGEALCLYHTLQAADGDADSIFDPLQERLHRAARACFKSLSIGGGCPAPHQQARGTSFTSFQRYVEALLDHASLLHGDLPFVLLLDEAEALLRMERPAIVLGNLRALCESTGGFGVQVVVAGFRGLRDFRDADDRTSPLTGLCMTRSLRLLPEDSVTALLAPLMERLPPELLEEAGAWLQAEAGGHPMILHRLCWAVQEVLEESHATLDLDALAGEHEDWFAQRAFKEWVSAWTDPEIEAFRTVLRDGVCDRQALGPERVDVLAYSGAVAVQGGQVTAPVGAFNRWYSRTCATRRARRVSRRTRMDLQQAKRAIAMTRAGNTVGTAFFITERLLLTCRHNLIVEAGKPLAREVALSLTAWEPEPLNLTAMATPLEYRDLALLELVGDPPAGLVPLPISRQRPAVDGPFWTWGFPTLVYRLVSNGNRFTGQVRDPQTRIQTHPAMQLHVPDTRDPVSGLSGAPILVGGRVVGVVSHHLLRKRIPGWDGQSALPSVGMFGALYGVPMEEAVQGFSLTEYVQPPENWDGLQADLHRLNDSQLSAVIRKAGVPNEDRPSQRLSIRDRAAELIAWAQVQPDGFPQVDRAIDQVAPLLYRGSG
ncbi:MAG: trypsin-like peptidase domain-containing protein [Alphaproteobacteria bacterium]|nr:trypsin-like peptidase domain-containing protein [Alphaproteobacteria bacterium]